jgi:hypothetical protein
VGDERQPGGVADDFESTCRRICAGRIKPKPGITKECRKLITGLLQQKTGKRLGNLSEGVAGIKADEFFAGTDGKSLDWQALVDRCGQFVDGPFKPKLKGQGDTSVFDS